MLRREAASRPDLGLPAGGNRHGESTGNHQDLACGDLKGTVQHGMEVEPRGLRRLIGGNDGSGVESFESEYWIRHDRRISSRRSDPWTCPRY